MKSSVGSSAGTSGELGTKPVVPDNDEYQLYWGFSFGWGLLEGTLTEGPLAKTMGVLAVALAAVNVFGGFLVTRRMLEMFRKKERPAASKDAKQ